MIKALSLAAALALLPLSAAMAGEDPGASEAAIEAAAEAFEARMEAFGERAEAISEDESLSEEQREQRIAALWAEYSPDVQAFTATVTEHAAGIAAEALAEVDLEAIIAEALADVDIGEVAAGAMAGAQGMAANGAWASGDPEHMQTYGLVAQYLVGEAMDQVDVAMESVAEVEVETAVADEG